MSLIKDHLSIIEDELNQMYADCHIRDAGVHFSITELEIALRRVKTAFSQVINVDGCDE